MSYLQNNQPQGASDKLSGLMQSVYTSDIMVTISDDHKDFENVKRVKVDGHDPRSIIYKLGKSFGSGGVQPAARGSVALPVAQSSKYEECEARLKRLYSAIEIDLDLWEGAKVTPSKFADPLAEEIKNKSTAQKRYLSGVINRDGSGVIGIVASDVTGTVINFEAAPSIGGAGAPHCDYHEVYAICRADGASSLVAGKSYLGGDETIVGLVEVLDIERNGGDNFVEVALSNSNASELGVSGATAFVITELAGVNGIKAGDVICKLGATVPKIYAQAAATWSRPTGQQPGEDDDGISANFDLAHFGNEIGGFYAIANNDGATYNGVTASGSTKASVVNASGELADLDHLQRMVNKLVSKMGSRYKYDSMLVSPGVERTFLQAQESDRRLVSHTDKERGFDGFGFRTAGQVLACQQSQFAFQKEINVVPKDLKGVVQMHGTDYKDIKLDNQSTFLKNRADGGYESALQKYMYATMTFVCPNPAAIGRVTDVGILGV